MNLKFIKKIISNDKFTNMTLKDNNFMFISGNKLYQYDQNLLFVKVSELPSNYQMLTYSDDQKNYLMLKSTINVAAIVDSNNAFLKNIKLDYPYSYKYYIKDLFYDKLSNTYLLVDKIRVYRLDSKGEFLNNEFINNEFYTLKCTEGVCCGKKSLDIEPKSFTFTAIYSDGNYKYVAYTKNNSCFLAKIAKGNSLIKTTYLGDNIEIKGMISLNNKIYALVNENDIYELQDNDYINPEIQVIIDKLINLIDLVSLSENNISGIIQSETNKINKILEISKDPTTILNTNESATNMVTETVKLENSQYDNLVLLLDTVKELEKYLN